MSKKKKIFIVAGESSGDTLGAKLISDLNNKIECELFGLGGEKMQQKGLHSLFPIQELSVMGFVEIIPNLLNITKRLFQLVRYVKQVQPDIIITIDSPGFNFRFIKKIQYLRPKIKFIHYVAPTVWAYNENRTYKVAKLYDHLLTLLPFEPAYFNQKNINTTFIGHPLLDHPVGNKNKFRMDHKISKEDIILCLSPGSRKNEIKQHLPFFIEATNNFLKKHNAIIVIPTFHHLVKHISPYLKSLKTTRIIISEDRRDRRNAIAASNIAITKCGTITNEFALNKVPMIACYKINAISAFFLKRVIKIKYFTLINILAKKEIIPECIQNDFKPSILTTKLLEVFNTKQKKYQLDNFEASLQKMRNDKNINASEYAANIITDYLS